MFKIRNENNLTPSASAELQFLGDELFYEVSYETLKLTGFFLKKKNSIKKFWNAYYVSVT